MKCKHYNFSIAAPMFSIDVLTILLVIIVGYLYTQLYKALKNLMSLYEINTLRTDASIENFITKKEFEKFVSETQDALMNIISLHVSKSEFEKAINKLNYTIMEVMSLCEEEKHQLKPTTFAEEFSARTKS